VIPSTGRLQSIFSSSALETQVEHPPARLASEGGNGEDTRYQEPGIERLASNSSLEPFLARGCAEGLSCGDCDRSRLRINAARFRTSLVQPRPAGRRAGARRLILRPMVPVPFAPRGRNRAARKQRRTTMTDTKTLTKADLIQFTGTEHWYRHAMVRDVLYTDGVK
jgi:hypothetical protein